MKVSEARSVSAHQLARGQGRLSGAPLPHSRHVTAQHPTLRSAKYSRPGRSGLWNPAVANSVSGKGPASSCGDPSGNSLLPGDPSLVMHTNVKLEGDQKMDFMKEMSAAIAEILGKPESYVAVCVMDGLDLIWGGEDTPCALCTVTSLGAINQENNAALSNFLCEKIGSFGIPPTRYYITFQDIPRPNMGYNGGTF